MDVILETDSLCFKYDKKLVLDGIDLEVKEGEILGILGPNGCGKTTLLRNLNKNSEPWGGCVLLDGKDLEELSKRDIAREVAVVPQTNEIRFSFSVREIVSMGRMPFQGMMEGDSSEDEKIIDDAMRQTGILGMADRHINTMSGGERQRVIIARAIAQTPKVLLMDEPTLHLDINMQYEVLDLVKRLSENNHLTVVIVSHDLPLVARYCDRVVLIHEHKIFDSGSPGDVLTPENMDLIFGIDAELATDMKTGGLTVQVHGSSRHI
jgi:iron complex transport system ATP-binding protein